MQLELSISQGNQVRLPVRRQESRCSTQEECSKPGRVRGWTESCPGTTLGNAGSSMNHIAIHKSVACERCGTVGIALRYYESAGIWLCEDCASTMLDVLRAFVHDDFHPRAHDYCWYCGARLDSRPQCPRCQVEQ